METSPRQPRTMGSLDILANAMTTSAAETRAEGDVEASVPTRLSSRSADTAEKSKSTSEYLEQLTLGIIDGVNSRQFEAHPSYANISPHWRAQSNDQSISYSLDQHFQITRELTVNYPDLFMRVVNTTVVMRYRDLCADVYMDMEHRGYPPGLVRTCIGVFHWKVFDEDGEKKWLCTKHTGARGMTGIEPLRECDALDDTIGW